MKKSITMAEIRATSTWSVKDDSPRGCKTVSNSEVKPGDMVVYENRFTLVIDDPEIEAAETETTTLTPEEVTAAIIEYFEENGDTFADCIEELDNYNGYLGDDRYYSMEELDEFYAETKPSEILERAFFGYDVETNSSGNREYGQFNPNREFFRYNGYGNLVSADYKDYSYLLDKYAVEAMAENRDYIDTINNTPELSELFNDYEEDK